MATIDNNFCNKICEALGIDPQGLQSVRINILPKSVVTVTVRRVVERQGLARLLDLFTGKEIEEDTFTLDEGPREGKEKGYK